jgi:hypothetical protein
MSHRVKNDWMMNEHNKKDSTEYDGSVLRGLEHKARMVDKRSAKQV